jgi:hypothetical protein
MVIRKVVYNDSKISGGRGKSRLMFFSKKDDNILFKENGGAEKE